MVKHAGWSDSDRESSPDLAEICPVRQQAQKNRYIESVYYGRANPVIGVQNRTFAFEDHLSYQVKPRLWGDHGTSGFACIVLSFSLSRHARSA